MNLRTFRNNLDSKVSAAKLAVATVTPLAMVSPFAFAAGESADIIATFAEYKTEAVLIIVGFAVVLWTLKGTGLLKPRG